MSSQADNADDWSILGPFNQFEIDSLNHIRFVQQVREFVKTFCPIEVWNFKPNHFRLARIFYKNFEMVGSSVARSIFHCNSIRYPRLSENDAYKIHHSIEVMIDLYCLLLSTFAGSRRSVIPLPKPLQTRNKRNKKKVELARQQRNGDDNNHRREEYIHIME